MHIKQRQIRTTAVRPQNPGKKYLLPYFHRSFGNDVPGRVGEFTPDHQLCPDSLILRPKGCNHIMLFPGSFNPPHRGHLDLLLHAFNNAGDDLHLVSAIVLPTDDEKLCDKTSGEERSIVIPKTDRAYILRHAVAKDNKWAFVYKGSHTKWKEDRQKLEADARKDGIDLKFILLVGPDWITTTSLYDPEYWQCRNAITSDASRPVDFRCPHTLRQLSGCTLWDKVRYEMFWLEKKIRAKTRGMAEEAINEAIKVAYLKLENVSVCQTFRKPKRTIRFVSSNIDFQPPNPPSSTKLRQILASDEYAEMGAQLRENQALNPGALLCCSFMHKICDHLPCVDGHRFRCSVVKASNGDGIKAIRIMILFLDILEISKSTGYTLKTIARTALHVHKMLLELEKLRDAVGAEVVMDMGQKRVIERVKRSFRLDGRLK
ncbi:hypothetical protein PT974_10719 [Cladobotryum mycophilum]|uniref:Cytidyltransferase-like domain-containing protein n=1 Tax=Cladobotryum mycophilum TaxID=491253 RepID=A0ABR0SAM1_9HYPO